MGVDEDHSDVMEMEGLSDSNRASFARLGLRALIAATMRKGVNTPLWAILAVSTRPRVWTQGEVSLVEEVAERIWAAVERARAEAAWAESEARLAAAFESVPVGAAVVDASGSAVLTNPGYCRFLPTGVIPSRDLASVGRWRGWDAAGRPLDARDFPGARALRGKRVVPGQKMIYTDDEGREIWTRVSSVPIRDAAGKVTGLATVITDIDAAKRSADALREPHRFSWARLLQRLLQDPHLHRLAPELALELADPLTPSAGPPGCW